MFLWKGRKEKKRKKLPTKAQNALCSALNSDGMNKITELWYEVFFGWDSGKIKLLLQLMNPLDYHI